MRIWLQSTRLKLYQDELDTFKLPSDTPMKAKQAFLLGTRNGGLALKRPDIGVLKVGARADVLVFSTNAIGLVGWTDPVAAIVLHSNVNDIQEVYIDGKLVKTSGKLVVDWEGLGYGKMLEESGARFRAGYAKVNLASFEKGIKALYGFSDNAFAPPFEVNVNRNESNA
jgi:cytosine/adenosine deaminase-related metal-dependent hydrolase